jgi:hypothetical protein
LNSRQLRKRIWQAAYSRIFARFAVKAAYGRREHIKRKLVANSGWRVQRGPFEGLEIPADISWGDGDIVPKLLGSYEEELHAVIDRVTATRCSTIVNVGCAEGYYATGFARILPEARIIAFDSDPEARRICQIAAERNAVSDRVEVRGTCSTEDLEQCLSHEPNSLLLMDCEGAELELLSPEAVPALRERDILVECHDFLDAPISDILRARFEGSHEIQEIREGPRDPNAYALLRDLDGLDRFIAVCEFRPKTMSWLSMWSESTSARNP